jgi:hypothetical protein
LCITEEILELKDMYGKSFAQQTVTHSADSSLKYHFSRTGGENAIRNEMRQIVQQTQMQINEYGSDFVFSVRGCDEECERELEMEVEEEEEIEVEVPSVDPFHEKEWDFNTVFNCQSPTKLPITVDSLQVFVTKFIKCPKLTGIRWAKNIYTTTNFAKTIACSQNSSLSQYLRVVNFVLRFPDDGILLLSEYEANHLLPLFWNYGDSAYQLMHMSSLRKSLDDSSRAMFQCLVQKPRTQRNIFSPSNTTVRAFDLVEEDSMSSMQLFAGEPRYLTDTRINALKSILRPCLKAKSCPLTEARRFVEMRGNEKLFPYSELEIVCEQLLCEPR